MPSSSTSPVSGTSRVPMVSVMARGCSKISFCMKCLKPAFSAWMGSQVMRVGSFVSGVPSKSVKTRIGLRGESDILSVRLGLDFASLQ